MHRIKFNTLKPGEKRQHYLAQEDVETLLSRLPEELWSRLRAVHFNDRSRGSRWLGYVNMGHREIAICALPPRVSLTRFLCHPRSTLYRLHRSPHEFGAIRGRHWPTLAVRRFMLYDVFLHELGHLQIIDPVARRLRRQFASETKAQAFADFWRAELWNSRFNHPDPVHNPPAAYELMKLNDVGANEEQSFEVRV